MVGADSSGVNIAWEAHGDPAAPAVMLLHSLGSTRSMWQPQVEALRPHFRVVVMDTRGHGVSDAPSGPYSLDGLGADVIAVADAAGLDRFHVAGISLGGMMALWAAIHARHRIRSIAACNTAARIGSAETWKARTDALRSGGMESLREQVLARWFAPGFAGRRPDWFATANREFTATDPNGYAGCCAALAAADLREHVARIDLPALIIGGQLDLSTPPDDARWLHAQIAGSRLVVFEEAAHLSNLDCPDDFSATLLAFLKAQPA